MEDWTLTTLDVLGGRKGITNEFILQSSLNLQWIFRKKRNEIALLLCVQIDIMRLIKGNTTILEGVLCYGNKNS